MGDKITPLLKMAVECIARAGMLVQADPKYKGLDSSDLKGLLDELYALYAMSPSVQVEDPNLDAIHEQFDLVYLTLWDVHNSLFLAFSEKPGYPERLFAALMTEFKSVRARVDELVCGRVG